VPLDKLLDNLFNEFCKKLVEEVQGGPANVNISSYVTRYGKKSMNYLSYEEFKEIYMNHVYHPTAGMEEKKRRIHDSSSMMGLNQQPGDEDKSLDAKVKALFRLFDTNSIGSVPRAIFEKTILENQPTNTILDRLTRKIKKGGDRMVAVLTEEFQEADIPFGCRGELPVSNFQNILLDYDIVMMA
jgi:hypothetical protein